jgi:hypothetical protein
MGLSPNPRKEALIEALVFSQSKKQQSIIIEDAFMDPIVRNHPAIASEEPRLRFLVAANLSMKDKAIGHLCILDTRPQSFGIEKQRLLTEFADTISDIWMERQSLYRELRRDGVHMQQSVLGVLRPLLQQLMEDANQIQQAVNELRSPALSASELDFSASVIENRIKNFQNNFILFEFMINSAIQVVSHAQEHHGMTMSVKLHSKKPLPTESKNTNAHESDSKYLYDWVLDSWTKSMSQLVYQFSLLSFPVKYHGNEIRNLLQGEESSMSSAASRQIGTANACKLTAHPDVLFFCITALVGHFYCSDSTVPVHIDFGMKSLKSKMPPSLRKAASFNSELMAFSSSAGSLSSQRMDSSFTAGSRFVSKSPNRFKLYIRVGVEKKQVPVPNGVEENLPNDNDTSYHIPPLPRDMRDSIDVLMRQYLQGTCRQVSDRSFQLTVPIFLHRPPLPHLSIPLSPSQNSYHHPSTNSHPKLAPMLELSEEEHQKTPEKKFMFMFSRALSASRLMQSSSNLVPNHHNADEENDVNHSDDDDSDDSCNLDNKLYPVVTDTSGTNGPYRYMLKPTPSQSNLDARSEHQPSSLWNSVVNFFHASSNSGNAVSPEIHDSGSQPSRSQLYTVNNRITSHNHGLGGGAWFYLPFAGRSLPSTINRRILPASSDNGGTAGQ